MESEPVTPQFFAGCQGKDSSLIWISEKEIPSIKVGMPAKAIWNDYEVPGKVVQVDLAMNPERRAFAAVVEFDNRDGKLLAGLTADIVVETYRNDRAIVVEIKHLLTTGGQTRVMVAKDSVAEARDLVLGRREGLSVEVLQGLETGEQLIVEGHGIVASGQKVKIIE